MHQINFLWISIGIEVPFVS